MAAIVVRADVGCLIGSEPILADMMDIGGGTIVYQLKVSGGGGGGGGGPVTQATVPWITAGSGGSFFNRSGTTPDLASHQIAAAFPTRRYVFIQNISNNDFWVNFGTPAVVGQPSIRFRPGAVYIMENNFINTDAIHLIGTIVGQAYVVKEA